MIPVLLAGLAGYALSNPRRRKHRRRNPEMFKWKISKAVLAELHYYESNVDPDGREMWLALEKAGPDGPKTLTLSHDASWDLHKALDDMADIKLNGGDSSERALGRATAKLRDKIAAQLNATNPRRNPLSLDALAMPAANLLWRKHGYQSPGHAEDLAMMARRGTTAAKLWARVAQITKSWLYGGKKRSNPPRGLSKEARAYLRINKRARAAHDRRDWKEADRLQAAAMIHYRKASADEQKAIQAAELTGMVTGFMKALIPRGKR